MHYSLTQFITDPADPRETKCRESLYRIGASDAEHQRILMHLAGEIFQYLKYSRWQVLPGPVDVRFPAPGAQHSPDTDRVVRPDLIVLKDPERIDQRGCLGAPDLVVEILSPSTGYRDAGVKLKLYERQGVREYWIVNPAGEFLMIYTLLETSFGKPEYLHRGDILTSTVLHDFSLPLKELWW